MPEVSWSADAHKTYEASDVPGIRVGADVKGEGLFEHEPSRCRASINWRMDSSKKVFTEEAYPCLLSDMSGRREQLSRNEDSKRVIEVY
jgi:hypothetical protein